METRQMNIPVNGIHLKGDLGLAEKPKGLVIFSHGSGSSRLSPRNRSVASALLNQGLSTLLFDLLTPSEDEEYERRFDIPLLTERLVLVTEWIKNQQQFSEMNIGYFGSSTGAASALNAAAILGPEMIGAVVSRGGRPDLAAKISSVQTPTLLLVGGNDRQVITLNREALLNLPCIKELRIIPGASHLFEEPGKLEEVIQWSAGWFLKYLYETIGKQ